MYSYLYCICLELVVLTCVIMSFMINLNFIYIHTDGLVEENFLFVLYGFFVWLII